MLFPAYLKYQEGGTLAMDSINSFKAKLEMLETMLSKMDKSQVRVIQLKRSVHVLKTLLKSKSGIKSPYGPSTPIVRFSIQ